MFFTVDTVDTVDSVDVVDSVDASRGAVAMDFLACPKIPKYDPTCLRLSTAVSTVNIF